MQWKCDKGSRKERDLYQKQINKDKELLESDELNKSRPESGTSALDEKPNRGGSRARTVNLPRD
jgi:hypothetical protein